MKGSDDVSGTDGSMESLSDIYKDVMKSASDNWTDVIDQKLFESNGSAFLHIFCWQIRGSFVVSVNMAVAMGMDFEYQARRRYNFSVRVKSKTSTNETIDLITPHYDFNFYVIGTIGVRAGLRLEMYVGLISLKIDRIGIVAEVGVYTQLWGYFFYHLAWTEGQGKESHSAGALLIEIGMYLDIKFVATLFNSSKLTWAPTIYANQWPLWSAGERQNVFGFADDSGKYDFKTVKTLSLPSSTYDMKSMDLQTGAISTVNKDDATESNFRITFTNPAFDYNRETNTVTIDPADSVKEETDMVITWEKAQMAFSSQPIQKVLHITWSDPELMRYISFDSMGGSAVPQISDGSGKAITWPANPTRTGYEFSGWYTDSACTAAYTGSTTVMPTFSGDSKGMTLYAKWKPVSVNYTVEHYLEELNGTYTLKETEQKQGLTEDQTEAEANTTYTGFTAKAFKQQDIAADGSTVIRVYYDRDKHTVTWRMGYDGANDIPQSYKYGAALNAPIVRRDGYTFDGWYTDKDAEFNTTGVTVSSDLTLYAKWTGKKYTVTLDVNGGDALSGDTTKTVICGQPYGALPEPTRTGYGFAGWYTAKNGDTKVDENTAVQTVGDHTLYAKWTGKKYTVTLNPMDGTLPGTSTITVTFGQAYGSLPTPELPGYNFVGWFMKKGEDDTEVTEIKEDTVVERAENHELFAKWTANGYTVTFDPTGGELTGASTRNVTFDQAYGELPAPTRTGYTFAGWFTEQTGGTEVKMDTTVQTAGNHTLYAHWTANKYTVTLDVNDGDELGTSTITVTYDAKYGELPTPTRTGHTFNGWYTTKTGSTKVTADTVVKTDKAHTLYARWTAESYSITYQNLEGASNPNPKTYTYGSAVTLKDLTRTGYTFDGWFKDAGFSGNAVTEIAATETGDKTLYAKWTANTHTVTLKPNGGTLTGEDTVTVTYGAAYTLPTPDAPDSNYAFAGWYQGEQRFDSEGTYQIDEDITLTAKWVVVSSKTTSYEGFTGAIDLYVGGVQMNSEGGDIEGIKAVEYDKDKHIYTLTLFGYTYEADTCAYTNQFAVIDFDGNGTDSLVIKLEGINTLTCNAPHNASGIWIEDANLTIGGSGTLNVTANSKGGTGGYGIFLRDTYTLAVEGGTVNIAANIVEPVDSTNLRGWSGISGGTLRVSGGTVTVMANQYTIGDSYGLVVDKVDIQGGSFTAQGHTSVTSRGTVSITLGSNVTAVASTSYDGTNPTEYANIDYKNEYGYYKYFHAYASATQSIEGLPIELVDEEPVIEVPVEEIPETPAAELPDAVPAEDAPALPKEEPAAPADEQPGASEPELPATEEPVTETPEAPTIEPEPETPETTLTDALPVADEAVLTTEEPSIA